MHRITSKDVERAFLRFTKACGHAAAKTHEAQIGWTLDYNPHYGGYTITAKGGSTHPMGTARYPAREFYEMMHFAIAALDAKR